MQESYAVAAAQALCNILTDWVFYVMFISAYIVQYYIQFFTSGLPPGPIPLPIIGNLHQLGGMLHVTLRDMAKEYGDVFTVYLGPQPTIILTNYPAIHEAFVQNAFAFSGRGVWLAGRDAKGKHGISANDGRPFRIIKQFVLGSFRNLGVGKSALEDHIRHEASCLVSELESKSSQPINMQDDMLLASCNVISHVLFGKRFEYNDPTFKKMVDTIEMIMKSSGASAIVNYYPILAWSPGDPFMYKSGVKSFKDLMIYCQNELDNYRRNPGEQDQCLTSAFIKRQQQEENNPEMRAFFTDLELQAFALDLFSASDTTSTTLLWACHYLSGYREIQEKIHQEIISNIGSELPTWDDKEKLPYTEACLAEISRLGSIVPLTLPHKTFDNATVVGTYVPEGISILANLWSMHHNPKNWPDPEVLNPDRFMSDDRCVDVKKVASFMPFSGGSRRCIGENVGKVELFIFFSALLQNFKISYPGEQPMDPLLMEPCQGTTLQPRLKTYKLEKRKIN